MGRTRAAHEGALTIALVAILVTLAPQDGIDRAVELMRRHAVRRLPVVDSGRPIGIVSLGDLAVERDPRSALGEISAAEPNR